MGTEIRIGRIKFDILSIDVFPGVGSIKIVELDLFRGRKSIFMAPELLYTWDTDARLAYLSIPGTIKFCLTANDLIDLYQVKKIWELDCVKCVVGLVKERVMADGPDCSLLMSRIQVEGTLRIGYGPNMTNWVQNTINFVTKEFFSKPKL